jgi:hypothetical protein
MKLARVTAVAFASSLALAAVLSDGVGAAEASAVASQIEAQNKAFAAACEAGDVGNMKGAVKKAVSLGEKNGLGDDPVMADTFVLAAILRPTATRTWRRP